MYTERLRQLEEVVAPSHVSSRMETSDYEAGEHSVSTEEPISIVSHNYEVAGLGIGFASMVAEVIMSHPFIVIRSQCQVRSNSTALHLLPFSLLLVVSKSINTQGFGFLWKGLGSVFLVKGLSFISENLISEMTSLPKEASKLSSFRRIGGHLLLRTLSWILVTPFYAASVVELVQSDRASEPTTLVSCLRDGFYRLFHMHNGPHLGRHGPMFRSGVAVRSPPSATSRLLPVWRLIPPVVLLNVSHYVIRSIACVLATSYWGGEEDRLEREAEINRTLKTGGMDHARFRTCSQSSMEFDRIGAEHKARELSPADLYTLAQQRHETALQSVYWRYYTDLVAAMTASFVADVVTYPLETLVVRLCVQGTRTLVDNMDTGDVVVPVTSAYEGLFDAARVANTSPLGMLGLYRGFGALIAQYAFHAAFLYGIRSVYQQLLYLWSPSAQSAEATPPVLSRPYIAPREETPL